MRLGLLALVAMLMVAGPVTAQDAALVSVAATPSGDGVLTVPVGGIAAFAFAALNYGAAEFHGCISISMTDGELQFVNVCLTDPTTGQCGGPISAIPCHQFPIGFLDDTLRFDLASGQIVTGTVWVQANGQIPFDPQVDRVTVIFSGGGEISVGLPYSLTSVAVKTR
jgi:hypothetical protein